VEVFWILLRATTDCRSNGALSSSLLDHNPPPQHTGKIKKHRHHDRHDPPASSGSNFRGKCDRRTSRNQSRWFRCGDLTFIGKINSFLILFSIILCASAGRAGGQKVSFLCYFIVLLLFRWFDTTRTDPSYSPISFFPWPPQYSSCFSLISDRGGDAPWSPDKRAGTNDRALSHLLRESV
jgi:hypothetical protein